MKTFILTTAAVAAFGLTATAQTTLEQSTDQTTDKAVEMMDDATDMDDMNQSVEPTTYDATDRAMEPTGNPDMDELPATDMGTPDMDLPGMNTVEGATLDETAPLEQGFTKEEDNTYMLENNSDMNDMESTSDMNLETAPMNANEDDDAPGLPDPIDEVEELNEVGEAANAVGSAIKETVTGENDVQENVGESLDNATDEIGEFFSGANDSIDNAAEETMDATDEAIDNTGDAIEEGTDEVEDRMDNNDPNN